MSTRWSYHVAEIKPDVWGRMKPEALQDEINKLGAQGWELVNVVTPGIAQAMVAFFKKPL